MHYLNCAKMNVETGAIVLAWVIGMFAHKIALSLFFSFSASHSGLFYTMGARICYAIVHSSFSPLTMAYLDSYENCLNVQNVITRLFGTINANQAKWCLYIASNANSFLFIILRLTLRGVWTIAAICDQRNFVSI